MSHDYNTLYYQEVLFVFSDHIFDFQAKGVNWYTVHVIWQ